MVRMKSLALLAAPIGVALVVWSCDPQRSAVAPIIGTPLAHFHEFQCTPFKMTGGGRIDYPPGTAEKNPPASHRYETFGAHVMDQDGDCVADQGALEWVDHRPEMRVNGQPLNLHATEVTFAEVATDADCRDGAVHWGGKLRVQNTGQEGVDFVVWDCDDGEPGVSDGFAIAVDLVVNGEFYAVTCPESHAEPTCTLTGGNRQFHPTH